MGVSPDEGLAFIYSVDDAPELFLDEQPPGTTGLARRLDPEQFYIACRWDYDLFSKEDLLEIRVAVYAPKTGQIALARPADWGPHEDTDRIADLSPGLLEALGIETDDEVEIVYPVLERRVIEFEPVQIAISSGHGKYVRGADGYIDEVNEARRVVNRVAQLLTESKNIAYVFHDNVSKTQEENLHRIVDWHNSKERYLDVSVHFNANEPTTQPMGTECLYVSQQELASVVSRAISEEGQLKDRGPKKRTDLYFLNNTNKPAILIEVCFVDSEYDADTYLARFEEICTAIAHSISN